MVDSLTNVALAIRQEPRIVEVAQELIIMGGALRYGGIPQPWASSILT